MNATNMKLAVLTTAISFSLGSSNAFAGNVQLGTQVSATGAGAIAIGTQSEATKSNSIAIGEQSVASGIGASGCAEIERLCRILNLSHGELINRMITAFSLAGADSLSVLMNTHSSY